MLSQQVLTLAREDKKIILALLTHPRLISLRREFQERVCDVLGDEREFDRLSHLTEVPPDLLGDRTRRMLLDMESDRPSAEFLDRTADTALLFFASPRLINLWGHFTMALQKIMVDDLTVGEVADSCGVKGLGRVRSAIREFSSESGSHAGHPLYREA